MFLENELSLTLPLDGEWDFKLGESPWQKLPVPAAWEAHLDDKLTDGPALYRRTFTVPESWLSSAALVFEADGISFDADVRLNGQPAGHHQGMWSSFQLDIKPLVKAGENTLEIEIWKPGGRFPVRQALAGFLPDVATTFGGLWQGLRLRVFSWAALDDLRVFAYGGGWLDVQGRIVGMGERRKYELMVEVFDPAGEAVARTRANMTDEHSFAAHLETGRVRNWTPTDGAALYSVRIALRAREADIARVIRRVGFRDLEVGGRRVLLNSQPLHLRGVLSWGWDAARIAPVQSRVEAAETFDKLRALGFNLYKLCLFVPDDPTFDVADEAGLLLWLEMPLWLPDLTPALRELIVGEYREVFRRLHHHPSIAVVSLGCELNASVDAGLLDQLTQLARDYFPNALHCDNSGSAEAYGGVQTALGDFTDYHFYTDPHFFEPLARHFDRAYQANRPWIYGEFCDADTLRDYSMLGQTAWWLTDSTALERDDFLAARDWPRRLAAAGVRDCGAALSEAGRHQATEVRKVIIEQARLNQASGGYVVTGWSDTPITTSGIVDDARALKFSGEEWRRFNADLVLLLDRERRRRWAGGDRPALRDPFTMWSGETAELHLIVSNGGAPVDGAHLTWRLMGFNAPDAASGKRVISAGAGTLLEGAVVTARLPLVEQVTEFRLIATLTDELHGRILTQNIWKLWVIPKTDDPGGRVARALNPDLLARVRAGEQATLWLTGPDPRFTRGLPFWREAIHVFEDHPLWAAVPQPGFADMRFFGVATDFALDSDKLAAVLGPEFALRPVWRRFDARQLFWTDYLIEARAGAGRLWISSLRFAGGLGAQAEGMEANPLGAWLLQALG